MQKTWKGINTLLNRKKKISTKIKSAFMAKPGKSPISLKLGPNAGFGE